ncbi:MAG: hypothetical protein M0018_04010 [Nitrospiraceae bacterium]|nr:hypothetical protein [Nitrospiraceae bacterium]
MLKPMDRKKENISIKSTTASQARKPQTRKTGIHGCGNKECRLRRAGCAGFEGCPGYKAAGA